MKHGMGLIPIIALLVSCDTSPYNTASQKMSNDIEGTWKLISGTTITTITQPLPIMQGIKV